ncbi:MAG: thioredoxin domain-containing protein, partial [Cryobacterium sp.]
SAPGDFVPGDSAEFRAQGTVGAARFDEGYLSLGAGPVVVDVYFDVMCPFCKAFDDTNGPQLALAVTNDTITLRLHALTFLDRASAGTEYSSRASAALTCQATLNPDGTLSLLAALYAAAPVENSAGHSDAALVRLAGVAAPGGTSIADCVDAGAYQAWSQQNTERAFTGPIEASEIAVIEGTPTVLVDGAVYPGSITDADEFNAFVAAAF